MLRKTLTVFSLLGLTGSVALWIASPWDIFGEWGTHSVFDDQPARIRKVSCRLVQGQAKLSIARIIQGTGQGGIQVGDKFVVK